MQRLHTILGATAASFLALETSHFLSSCDIQQRVVYINPTHYTAVKINELNRFLEQRGSSINAIDIKTSAHDSITTLDPGSQFGVYANEQTRQLTACSFLSLPFRWAGYRRDTAIASFPIETNAITAATVINHSSIQGPGIVELLENNVIDERMAVIVHLVIEKSKGKTSQLFPWIALLPTSFSTPLFWSKDELEWLKGTSLYHATLLKKKALDSTWRRIEPFCRQLALKEGATDSPTFSDFLWAYSVFWSRALSFPFKNATTGDILVQEGIIPGLDFCNHSSTAPCYYAVMPGRKIAAQKASSLDKSEEKHSKNNKSMGVTYSSIAHGAATTKNNNNSMGVMSTTEMKLMCSRSPRGTVPGTELTINYGNKPNEELLFLYGFVEESNPNDALMVPLPLPPPAEWDAVLRSRVALLQRLGLSPQLFLTAEYLLEIEESRWKEHRRGRKKDTEPHGRHHSKSNIKIDIALPQDVAETLKVFVMDAGDVQRALIQHQEDALVAVKKREDAMEESGMRLAIATTLVRLLELKLEELENVEQGTGTLQHDENLLAQSRRQEKGSSKGADGMVALTDREKNALMYRMGCKKLTRSYLAYANELLHQEMRRLRDFQNEL